MSLSENRVYSRGSLSSCGKPEAEALIASIAHRHCFAKICVSEFWEARPPASATLVTTVAVVGQWGIPPFRGRKFLLFDEALSAQRVGFAKHDMLRLFLVAIKCRYLANHFMLEISDLCFAFTGYRKICQARCLKSGKTQLAFGNRNNMRSRIVACSRDHNSTLIGWDYYIWTCRQKAESFDPALLFSI
jgi:hypothetical protein